MSKKIAQRKSVYLWWIASIVGTFIFLALIYCVAQYVIVARTNAPRIKEADDIAWKVALQLEKNGKIEPISSQITYYDGSTTPTIIVFSEDGQPLDTLGIDINNVPELPQGTLENTQDGEKNIFSWQPEGYAKSDYVVVTAGEYGYVLVGLDSVTIEDSLNKLFYILLITFVFLSVAITTASIVQNNKK